MIGGFEEIKSNCLIKNKGLPMMLKDLYFEITT
jgi:hypothetical protein